MYLLLLFIRHSFLDLESKFLILLNLYLGVSVQKQLVVQRMQAKVKHPPF